MAYRRMGPTPWVSTSQPASVSIGEPQLPTWISSQPRRGRVQRHRRAATGSSSSSAVRPMVSPSERHSARWRPPTVRGNSAMPLLRAAGPRIGVTSKRRRSSLLEHPRPAIVPAVVGGVGGAVRRLAVVAGEADEPGVLHAVALRRRWPATAPAGAAGTSAGNVDGVAGGVRAAQLLQGVLRGGPGEQVGREAGRAPARTSSSSNRSGSEPSTVGGDLVVPAVVGQARRRAGRAGARRGHRRAGDQRAGPVGDREPAARVRGPRWRTRSRTGAPRRSGAG